jgi:hypothetical protein
VPGASGAPARMSNVLSDTKREQVLALGQLGWPLREIERKTGVRRETISGYLTAAEIAIRPERGRKLLHPNPASSEITGSAGYDGSNPASSGITDSNRLKDTSRSICAPYHEFIEDRRKRNRPTAGVLFSGRPLRRCWAAMSARGVATVRRSVMQDESVLGSVRESAVRS